MNSTERIYIENEKTSSTSKEVKGTQVHIEGELYYKISNVDEMRPFFMSIVSASNHWMFISSNGGLTAGRQNAEYSLFPYYTDDKIVESADITGSKTIFQVRKAGQVTVWEPFSERFEGKYNITRNLYKNSYGNKVLFEEINHDLELTYSYQWSSSDTYGFVRKSKIVHTGTDLVNITILDGIQNILPYGVGSNLQNASSNLVDAYKRSELHKKSGVGIFALSAIIVDKAEPSEALKANVVWSLGIENPTYLLSSKQLKNFRRNLDLTEETDVKAEKGAYFISANINIASQNSKEWYLIADVNKNHSQVIKLSEDIQKKENLLEKVIADVHFGTQQLVKLNASADGIQYSADRLRDIRHFSNTLFNIMRGGIFDDNYTIEKRDFTTYINKANKKVARNNEAVLEKLTPQFSLFTLQELAYETDDKNFRRLCLEYMPLKFSRRHGDPSRPWNKFSINTRNEDGSKKLDYEGNWRDIFQNWEALAHSYPAFIESMLHKFLNATTFDGYNPYRVTKDGFDWETIEPDNPWSYIGYWGDHQIIYLLKFLEFTEKFEPKKLESFFNKELFVYANVPYKIKAYEELLKNPKDTIVFDESADARIRQERDELGSDGALLRDENRFIIKVNFIEKILATTLAKIANFIPEGGIWMNTQRPEWNDANNALVGNGVSMVTLYYLRRFLSFFNEVFAHSEVTKVEISKELMTFYSDVLEALENHKELLSGSFTNAQRKQVLDDLGQSASNYRLHIYQHSFSGRKEALSIQSLKDFVSTSLAYLEHSIEANKRSDSLYHAYNLMTLTNDKEIAISYLDEMLEGQVAVLSSGYLNSSEVLRVLDAMKESKLFREDQYSYLLYPNKELKGFVEKNSIPKQAVEASKIVQSLVDIDGTSIVEKDVLGGYHFNGNFKNADDLALAIDNLSINISENEKSEILQIFEEVFNHKAFTGRSGTFYGYEGLGSIYWHMVSKLQLAVQECCLKAIEAKESAETVGRLLEHYYEINEGIGVHKPPTLYGAFPTDPYSHTPAGKGAQQPGMTGQVKEDVLSRFGELGVFVSEGKLYFNPCLLRRNEFISESKNIHYVSVKGEEVKLNLPENTLFFTYCQVPVIYTISEAESIEVHYSNGNKETLKGLELTKEISEEIFNRTANIAKLHVFIKEDKLK
ncbi:hypothetical protein P8625_02430 [Tenacibaculum tangerinum]|uniref:Cellobiose phosphorylase n=1 Tax=Tenacibaculum tangerinum TaxID=3038772 RepID=A0ABY8L3N6_9FLAO|nr:hypothetical protein [Tenacibaculum tangerinum]WGH76046.1 hypothetical protein P8625_02430 [Tenacibaculum tangerinum]